MIMETEHPCMDIGAGDPLARQYGLGGAAMRYQRMGYRVLPLAQGSKRPHPMLGHSGGVHHASNELEQAAAWWSQDPAAGVGVATGQGLVVWDLDVKHGEDGPAEFARTLAPWLPVDIAPVARTPSGGWHVWMRVPPVFDGDGRPWPGPVPMRPGLMPGVDVKGDGGYVAAWPTRVWVTGREGEALLPYEWVSGCPCTLPEVPAGVLPWLASAPSTGSASTGGGVPGSAPDYDAAVEHGLAAGSRNVELYRLACSEYRRFGTEGDGRVAAETRIGRVLARTDRRDFGAAEVRTILASALAFVRKRETDDRELLRGNPWMG
jgi:hypothetical protein